MDNGIEKSVQETIMALRDRGALFVINHSGGKDSQAMYLHVRKLVPKDQIAIVHADLGPVEWAGAIRHIQETTSDEPLHVCKSRRTLLEMIEQRGMFPSPTLRQCTSDLKRGVIEKTIRGITKDRKAAGNSAWGLVVNCMGMRAQESSSRAKLVQFKQHLGNSKAGREFMAPSVSLKSIAWFRSIELDTGLQLTMICQNFQIEPVSLQRILQQV